ncbi:unnamed protein product, partial [Closterium sp. NIES-54]
TAALQDAMVTTTSPGGQRVSICICTRTGFHQATFTHPPGSSQYTVATEPPQVATSAQVSASGQVATSCSCRLLSHQTLLWHHRLPRLRGMHSRLLVSGLRRSLPPLPPSPALPCLPFVEGWQRATPHSSSFPPTTAPLQTLHMDVWGPAHVSGQGHERYFLQVVVDNTRYTTVFPLRSKGEVDLPVLRLHSDRSGEFSSDLLRDFCRGEGILETFTLPDSPQQNRIAECRIGLVMEVTRTSMIHAAAPHFLWPFADRYAAHQLNLWPRVSLPETSPTLRWAGQVNDASVFRDVTFDESVPFYRLFPYRSAPPPPPPLFLAPGPPPVDPLPPEGPAPSGVSQVDPFSGTAPVKVAVVSGAARGAASGGAEPRSAESEERGARSAQGGTPGSPPRPMQGRVGDGPAGAGACFVGGFLSVAAPTSRHSFRYSGPRPPPSGQTQPESGSGEEDEDEEGEGEEDEDHEGSGDDSEAGWDPETHGGGKGGEDEEDHEMDGLEPEEVEEGVREGGEGATTEAASQHVAEGGGSVGVKVGIKRASIRMPKRRKRASKLRERAYPCTFAGKPLGEGVVAPEFLDEDGGSESRTASGGALGSGGMERFMTTKLSTEELRQAIAKLVVTCDLPFRIVESEAVSVPCLVFWQYVCG